MLTDIPNCDFTGVTIPAVVFALAGGRPVAPVWRNEIGGVTFELGEGEEFVKHGPPHAEFDPVAEAHRLAWVGGYVPVPRVIDHGVDADGALWLRSAGLRGVSAVLGGWRSRPEVVVPELGRALRRFHDSVPVAACPWDWSVGARVGSTRLAAELGPMPDLDPVVCHGDACNPNFLLDPDGRCVGYVDLGRFGVADRWADLAPALASLSWNFGPGWEPMLLAGYGIDPEPAKQSFYWRLWNLE